MNTKYVPMLILSATLVSVVMGPVNAQDPAASSATPSAPVQSKRELITELLHTMNLQKTMASMFDAVMAQMQSYMKASIPQLIEYDPSMTSEDRKELKAVAEKSASDAFTQFVKLFKAQVDMAKVTEAITYRLYDKYYTADEIKDLNTFYGSPTGQKTLTIMPQLTAESMKIEQAELMPKIQSIMKQVMDEQTASLKTKETTITKKRKHGHAAP